MKSSLVMKLQLPSDFSKDFFGLVVYDTLDSNKPPYFLIISLIKVPFPTPDGPTTISGLYFNGVGLKGWKYSFAKTNTSF